MSEIFQKAPTISGIWPPEQAPYGFRVEMLPERPAPIAVSEAFLPLDTVTLQIEERIGDPTSMRTVQPGEVTRTGERCIDVEAHLWIPRRAFDAVIEARGIDPMVKTQDMLMDADVRSLNLVDAFPSEQADAITRGVETRLYTEYMSLDWIKLTPDLVGRQELLSQIVLFESSGRRVRMYNFSRTVLTPEAIGKVANGLREKCDRTGAAVVDMLDVMAVVPIDDEVVYPTDKDGGHREHVSGAATGGVVVFSEGLFDPTLPLPPLTAATDYKTEITAETPLHILGDEIQLTVFHELAHVVAANGEKRDQKAVAVFALAVGWKEDDVSSAWTPVAPGQRKSPENPVVYGREDPHEDLAVTAEGQFAGGEWSRRFDEGRRRALNDLYASRHSGIEGPTFVVAREEALPVPGAPLGRQDTAPLAVVPQFTYHVYLPFDSK